MRVWKWLQFSWGVAPANWGLPRPLGDVRLAGRGQRAGVGVFCAGGGNLRLYQECTTEASGDCAVSAQFTHLRAAKHRIESFMTPLSRSVLGISALLMFATKVGIERRGRREGTAMEAHIDMFLAI